MITYRLSNRQQKELLIRGQRLTIAIPVDYDEHPDAMAFARLSMPEHAEQIVSAEHEEIRIGKTAGASTGLTGMLGVIDGGSDNAIYYWMSVVVCVLESGKTRGELPMQWPGVAFFPSGVEVR